MISISIFKPNTTKKKAGLKEELFFRITNLQRRLIGDTLTTELEESTSFRRLLVKEVASQIQSGGTLYIDVGINPTVKIIEGNAGLVPASQLQIQAELEKATATIKVKNQEKASVVVLRRKVDPTAAAKIGAPLDSLLADSIEFCTKGLVETYNELGVKTGEKPGVLEINEQQGFPFLFFSRPKMSRVRRILEQGLIEVTNPEVFSNEKSICMVCTDSATRPPSVPEFFYLAIDKIISPSGTPISVVVTAADNTTIATPVECKVTAINQQILVTFTTNRQNPPTFAEFVKAFNTSTAIDYMNCTLPSSSTSNIMQASSDRRWSDPGILNSNRKNLALNLSFELTSSSGAILPTDTILYKGQTYTGILRIKNTSSSPALGLNYSIGDSKDVPESSVKYKNGFNFTPAKGIIDTLAPGASKEIPIQFTNNTALDQELSKAFAATSEVPVLIRDGTGTGKWVGTFIITMYNSAPTDRIADPFVSPTTTTVGTGTNANTVAVSDTSNFTTSGNFIIASKKYSYSGITATSFTGVSPAISYTSGQAVIFVSPESILFSDTISSTTPINPLYGVPSLAVSLPKGAIVLYHKPTSIKVLQPNSNDVFKQDARLFIQNSGLFYAVPGAPLLRNNKVSKVEQETMAYAGLVLGTTKNPYPTLEEYSKLIEQEFPLSNLFAPTVSKEKTNKGLYLGNLYLPSLNVALYDDDTTVMLVQNGEAQPGVSVQYKLHKETQVPKPIDATSPSPSTAQVAAQVGDVDVTIKMTSPPAYVPIRGQLVLGAEELALGVRIASSSGRLVPLGKDDNAKTNIEPNSLLNPGSKKGSSVVSQLDKFQDKVGETIKRYSEKELAGEFYFNFQAKNSKGESLNLNKYGTIRMFDEINIMWKDASERKYFLQKTSIAAIRDSTNTIVLKDQIRVLPPMPFLPDGRPTPVLVEIPQTPLHPARKYRLKISCVDKAEPVVLPSTLPTTSTSTPSTSTSSSTSSSTYDMLLVSPAGFGDVQINDEVSIEESFSILGQVAAIVSNTEILVNKKWADAGLSAAQYNVNYRVIRTATNATISEGTGILMKKS